MWIITVGHWLKPDQHGSMATQKAPDWIHGRFTIACQYSLQFACVQILLADSGQLLGGVSSSLFSTHALSLQLTLLYAAVCGNCTSAAEQNYYS